MELSEVLNVDDLIYKSTPPERHKKAMEQKVKLFKDVDLPKDEPPANSSKTTKEELTTLAQYNNGEINLSIVKQGDNILESFKKYLKKHNLRFNERYYEQIKNEAKKFVLTLKYKHNRPRPKQLAKHFGTKGFEHSTMASMKTPSFPSGHSAIGTLIALALAKEFPSHKKQLLKLGKFISNSRLMARAHFPSDVKVGEKLGKALFKGLK